MGAMNQVDYSSILHKQVETTNWMMLEPLEAW